MKKQFEKRRICIASLKEWLEIALNNEEWLYEYTGKHPRDELFGGLLLVLDIINDGKLPEIETEMKNHDKDVSVGHSLSDEERAKLRELLKVPPWNCPSCGWR